MQKGGERRTEGGQDLGGVFPLLSLDFDGQSLTERAPVGARALLTE